MKQVNRERLVVLVLAILVALLASLVRTAGAQEYQPTLVAVDSSVVRGLGSEYMREGREHLYCVVKWSEVSRGDYSLVSVLEVREERVAASYNRADIQPSSCRDGQTGERQPTIHSHPEGQCQASPNDRRNFGSRGARFDGILCGSKQFVWYFSDQINAIEFAFNVKAIPPRH